MLKNVRLSTKLYAGFIIIVLVMVIQAAITLESARDTSASFERNTHTYNVMMLLDDIADGLVNVQAGERGFIITGNDAAAERVQSGRETVDHAIKELQAVADDNDQLQRRLQRLENHIAIWMREHINRNMDDRRDGGRTGPPPAELVQRYSRGEGQRMVDDMLALLDELMAAEEQLLAERAAATEGQIAFANRMTLISTVVGIALALFIATLLNRAIGRGLTYMREVAEATADGDLTIRIDVERNDEIGDVFKVLARMQQSLRGMMSEIAQGSAELKDAADRISSVSTQTADSANQQSESASQMATAVEELTHSISDVSSNADRANEISARAGQLANDGNQVINKTSDGMERIADTVRTTSKDIAELGERSKEISSIINTIREIADQTNLLALNAAIEAARAGEQGRGFAVVADEVRGLAERTSKSTDEIANMIGAIQKGTEQAVAGMESGVALVDEGVSLSAEAGESMTDIRKGAEEVLEVVHTISEALKEQSRTSNEVAQTIENMARMAHENSEAAIESSAAAEQLTNLSNSLDASVKRFRLE